MSPDEIERASADLQRKLHAVRTDSRCDAADTANRLLDLERLLLEVAAASQRQDVRGSGETILREVEDWAGLCDDLRLHEAADEARRSIADFARDSARAWKQRVDAELSRPTSDMCLQRLLETTARRCQSARLAAGATPGDDALAEIAAAVQQTFLECLQDESPSDDVRQRWLTDLSDLVDLVRTTIDDMSPERAALQLQRIEELLVWYLRFVESSRGARRRKVRRTLARVRAELQERHLQARMERRFGLRFVRLLERVVFFLICLVVILITMESLIDLSPRTIYWFNLIDLFACVVFLGEFFIKLWLVPGRARWFRRHFLIDLIPSIPIGVLFAGLPATGHADVVRFGRLVRFLRLPRLARYVRLVRPLLRMLRGFGLIVRGMDRLARRYGHLLNQNVILYPTRAELRRAESSAASEFFEFEQVRGRLGDAWKHLLTSAGPTEQRVVAAQRQRGIDVAFQARLQSQAAATAAAATRLREIPIGTLIQRLESCTPQAVSDQLGEVLVQQLARAARIFARPPLRWLPIVRPCVPVVRSAMTDDQVVAEAAQRLACMIKRYYNAWCWVVDLYGTVTASQFVGRVGTMLIKRASRPAYRLALFGGFYLLTELVLSLAPSAVLGPLRAFLRKFVGTTILVVGVVCFVILAVGFWLKRIAREATEFYEHAVQAQFLSLTVVIRTRHLARDVEILYDRVFRPACLIQDGDASSRRDEHLQYVLGRVQQSLLDSHVGGDDRGIEGLNQTILLYRDWLDGALLTDTDTRATRQLLGNPAIRQALSLSGRVDDRQVKSLKRLDLVRQKSLLGGPYLWFNFIARSLAHSVAALLVDYNKNAIPLEELAQIQPNDRRRYQRWLSQEEAEPLASSEAETEKTEKQFITTSFNALHFLDFDPQRDREVEQQFGPEVLQRLQNDRSLMTRRIFGAYPMHDRPREQRVVNLLSVYNQWLAGGRVLLMPVYLAALGMRLVLSFLAGVARSVKEIRRPELRASSRDAAKAHFSTAVRKIERIRRPAVDASLRLRMKLDPEFLGVPLPGQIASTLGPADVDADLQFLNSDPATQRLVDEQRQRAWEDMQRLQVLIDDGLLQRAARAVGLPAASFTTAEHLRAAAVAYLGDYCGVRRCVSGRALLDQLLPLASDLVTPVEHQRPRPLLWCRFRQYWRRHGTGDRRAAWRAVRSNVRGLADALQSWGRTGDAGPAQGERALGELLLHPGRISQQLTAVRVIQTLAVLDVLNYRQHIYYLGRYAELGDAPGQLLAWNTVSVGVES